MTEQFITQALKTECGYDKFATYADEHADALISRLRKLTVVTEDLDVLKKALMYGKPSALEAASNFEFVTERVNHNQFARLVSAPDKVRVLHGILGLATEVGELVQWYLNWIDHEEWDTVNLGEEMGDLFWYCALIIVAAKLNMPQILDAVLAKLALRNQAKSLEEAKFNADATNARDVEAERKLLDNALAQDVKRELSNE